MRKYFVLLVIALISILILMYPVQECSASHIDSVKENDIEYTQDGTQIRGIKLALVYDTRTKIVYYKNGTYYLPYISERGGYYRYVKGQLVEIYEGKPMSIIDW